MAPSRPRIESAIQLGFVAFPNAGMEMASRKEEQGEESKQHGRWGY